MRRAWLYEPVAYLDRTLSSSDVTGLMAAAVMGIPALYVGGQLTDPAGAHLSPTQLLLGLPLGVLVGAAMVGATAWMSAYLGVPGVRAVRPAFGGLLAWPVALLRLLLQAGWAALVLRLAGSWGEEAAAELGVTIPAEGWMAAIALVGTFLAVVGPNWTAHWWVKRFSFWAGLALFMWMLWSALREIDFRALLDVPPSGHFWLGVDAIVGMAILFWAVSAEHGRLAGDEGSALSGSAIGFGVPALTYTLAGALVLPEVAASEAAGLALALPVSLAGGLVFAWLVAAEVDGIGTLIYGTATSISPVSRLIPGPAVAVVAGAGALALAVLGDAAGLVASLELLVAVLAPVVAVVLVDFYLIRRRDYSIDDLYSFGGLYGVLSPVGLGAVLVGVVVSLWCRPVGPPALVDLVSSIFSRSLLDLAGIPPLITSMLIAGGAYYGLGRWRITTREYLSSVRGI